MPTPPINPAYVEYRFSGGPANTDGNASLGGAKSSTVLLSYTLGSPTNVTGVTLLDGANCAIGNGTLTYTASGQTLQWTPAGGTIGAAVAIGGGDGRYTVKGANADTTVAYLFVSVIVASLPVINRTDTISVAAPIHNLYDRITKLNSFEGHVDRRCIYLHNAHPTDPLIGAKLYISRPPTGAATVKIGLDPAGVGGTATTIATETAEPAGVVFSTPLSAGTGLTVAQIAAGSHAPFWYERAVVAGNGTSSALVGTDWAINGGF